MLKALMLLMKLGMKTTRLQEIGLKTGGRVNVAAVDGLGTTWDDDRRWSTWDEGWRDG